MAEVYGNEPGFVTIRLPSIMDLDAKDLPLRKSLAIKYVQQSMENGLLGHHGLLVVQIVNSFEDVCATIQNLLMVVVIVLVMTLPNKIVLVACVNVSFIFKYPLVLEYSNFVKTSVFLSKCVKNGTYFCQNLKALF